MDSRSCHLSASVAVQRHQQQRHQSAVAGDTMCAAREPPPYPGHLKLWQQSGYSTSYSGSEASTDMSMSSLESLSTSARQEPQGEETVDISLGMVDGGQHPMGVIASTESASLLSLCDSDGNDIDVKTSFGDSGPPYYDVCALSGSWPTSTSAIQNATTSSVIASVSATQTSGYSTPKYSTQSSTADQRQQSTAVSAYAANSLIRQLLQTSPQFSHLLTDITPVSSRSQTSSAAGSPKLTRELRSDGRSLPATPPLTATLTTTTFSEQFSGSSTPASTPVHAINRRLVNRYVNIDNDTNGPAVFEPSGTQPSSAAGGRLTSRDRQRPSTAPAEHHSASVAAAIPAQTMLEQSVDRHRSFEVLDRVMPSDVPVAQNSINKDGNGNGAAVDGAVLVSTSRHNLLKRQQQVRRSSPPHEHPPTSCHHPTQPQQRGSPQQLLHLQRCSPQQQENTSVCPLQAHTNTPTHSPTGSQQNSQTVCAHAAIATRATQMVERLSEENQALRQELKAYYKKVSKLEKVERDIQKVNDAYEMLARHSQKRESLEKLMRLKLEAEISRLTESNQQIQNHLEHTLLQLQKRQGYGLLDSELKKELHHKDSLIATFIAQNNELSAAKRRLESEIGKQSATVQETRSRIKVLENVLAKEVLEKRRLDRQHSASSDHQLATGNNCDGCERTSGGKTDDDILPFKYQQCDTDDGISSDSESPTNVHSLIRQMQEKERHILRLQDEVARWEQKFLEETVFRQLAVDAISIPKDAKIAALVQNSADTDKLLSDARLEKLAYLKELHNAHERCAHLEVKVKSLQADLAERDSLVRVLQHHSSLSRTSSISSLLAASCGSPLHSPQQQHRSPMSTAVHGNGSKPASGASSRQGSQLSVGSLSLTKSNKLNGGNVAMSHDVHQMAALDAVSYNDYSGDDSDQLKQCFWQV